MYPGHWHYHWHGFGGHRRFHSRPSRLLWFMFGGMTASWWYHHKHTAHIEGSSWGACNRHHMHRWSAVLDRANNSEPGNEAAVSSRWHQQRQPVQLLPTGLPPLPAEEDKFRAFGNQAVDSMSEFSEATLDNILSTVQALKVKLAENRLARAKEQLDQQQQQQQQQETVQSSPSSSRGWDNLKRLI